MPTSTIHSTVLLHGVNLRHGTDGFPSPPKEGVLRIFSPLKIRRLRPGMNPRTTHTHTSFTLMGPCIVNVFKHNQQDATLHNGIYYYKCSTCFRRFLRPSSGAQNCIHSIVSWNCISNSLTIAVRSRKSSTNTRCCVYSFELLMKGGGTAWNM